MDFRVFPRRLAKVETFGHGVMDIGVGGYVFTGALVAGLAGKVPKLTTSTLPLLVIGGVRWLLSKNVFYDFSFKNSPSILFTHCACIHIRIHLSPFHTLTNPI